MSVIYLRVFVDSERPAEVAQDEATRVLLADALGLADGPLVTRVDVGYERGGTLTWTEGQEA